MPTRLRVKRPDPVLRRIVDVLDEYQSRHPSAVIEAYRQNSVSIRIRIISPEFDGLSRAHREEGIWAALNSLSDEDLAEISLLLLLSPAEAKSSFASQEFEDPVPSRL